MEDYSFETDDNAFHCIGCNERIKVEVVQREPRPITCEKCETTYLVAKSPEGEGMTVEVVTKSEPDAVSLDEQNIEEDE